LHGRSWADQTVHRVSTRPLQMSVRTITSSAFRKQHVTPQPLLDGENHIFLNALKLLQNAVTIDIRVGVVLTCRQAMPGQ
jgi:hypothetical protein